MKSLKNYCDENGLKKILEEWDYEKNDKNPDEISIGSKLRIHWKHEVNQDGKIFIHEWESKVYHRTSSNSGCPYCSNQKILPGYNDLEALRPDIAKEYDNDRNELKSNEIGDKSNKKAYWKHEVEKDGKLFTHEWEAVINSRTIAGNGCPICANKQIQKGFNDLKTIRPDLAKEWDYDKNEIKPTEVPLVSTKKVYWKHEVEKDGKTFTHEWDAVIADRTSGNNGCPYCVGKRVLKGYNDFASQNPRLLTEWDFNKNEVNPEEITYGSSKNIHWLCPKGHSYKANINDRKFGDGCPTCSKRLRTSIPEKIIYYYIKKIFPDAICSYKTDWLERKEIDIYIPSLKLGIEYDGQRYHLEAEKDLDKIKLCKKNGIRLIRIREPECPDLDVKDIYTLKTTKKNEIEDAILFILDIIKQKYRKVYKIDIDIAKDLDEILKLLE